MPVIMVTNYNSVHCTIIILYFIIQLLLLMLVLLMVLVWLVLVTDEHLLTMFGDFHDIVMAMYPFFLNICLERVYV